MSVQENHDKNGKVAILINKDEKFINRGPESVTTIKNLGGIPLAHELEEKVQGKLQPLPDNGTVDIKGGEQFFSHPRTGTSS